MNVKAALKQVIFFFLYYSGIEFLLTRLLSANAAGVIMYHGVCDHSKLPPWVDFHVTPAEFERHLRFLLRRYRIIPISELLERLRAGQRLNREIVLTLDDGYRNNLTHAAPLLARYRAPFSVFLTTGHIGTGEILPLNQLYALWSAGKIADSEVETIREAIRLQSREKASGELSRLRQMMQAAGALEDDTFAMLDWEQVRELEAYGAELGTHTHTHASMAAEPLERRREELVTSRQVFEQRMGKTTGLFAYPYGRRPYIDPGCGTLVAECGYTCAITTENGLVTPASDPYRLPRIGYSRKMHMFAGEVLLHFLKAQ